MQNNQYQEPSLADILSDLWAAKLWLVSGAFLGVLLAFLTLANAIPHHKATMLIAPAERAGGPDIEAILPGNSSFAVQYLVDSLGVQDSTDFIRFEHILRERTVAKALMEKPEILKYINQDKLFGFTTPDEIKTPEQLSEYLQDQVKIEPVGATMLRRVVYLHQNEDFAKMLLNEIHDIADSHIRREILATADKRAAYLQDAIARVVNPQHREALTALLMEQEHLLMILSVDEPFAAAIVEPPAVTAKPYWPKANLFYPAFILIGMLLAYMMRAIVRGRNPDDESL